MIFLIESGDSEEWFYRILTNFQNCYKIFDLLGLLLQSAKLFLKDRQPDHFTP